MYILSIYANNYKLLYNNLLNTDLEELNETITMPVNRNWPSVKQSLPVSLESFQLNSKLMHAPVMLREFIEQY